MIRVQRLQRLVGHAADLHIFGRQRGHTGGVEGLAGSAIQLANPVNVIPAGVALRLEEKRGMADYLGTAGGQALDQACVDVARPRPTAEIGNTLFVDGDQRDLVRRRMVGQIHRQIVDLAIHGGKQGGQPRQQSYNSNCQQGYI